MKSLIQIMLAIVIACGLLAFVASKLDTTSSAGGKDTLVVYNWGEYIDPSLIDQFEEETGISVIYETYDSNEAMLTKIRQGGSAYDVVVPSEYTIETMIEEDLLIEIDHSKLPNL
jgi:spermidine/putrescine transport system substrate-binding protein